MKRFRLKEIRIHRGYTQKEIAEAIGIHRVIYSRYETGKVDPRATIIQKLSEFYDLSADYIMRTIDRQYSLSDMKKTIIKAYKKEG